jgi:3D (Asp-Asp-Asp) domain-containing protein
MNSLKAIPLIFCLLAPASFAARDNSQLARVTVYWASGGAGSDRNTRNHRCATGARLRSGHCAVDPKHIPYGSRILLPNGETLAAVDTGSAVRNRKAARVGGRTAVEKRALVIDRFFETKRQAMTWANSHPAFMPIRVVPPNSGVARLQKAAVAPLRAEIAAGNKPALVLQPAANPSELIAANGAMSRASLNRMGR